MQPKSRRAAWIQGVVLVAAVVGLAAVLVSRLQRPFDRDTLSIPVEELRSQASEAAELERQLADDHLAPAFVRFHAQQLGHDVERTRDDLDKKPASGNLDPLRQQGLSFADALQSRLDLLARAAAPSPGDAQVLDELGQGLDDLAKRIKPEG